MFYSRDLSFDFTNQDIENWSRGGEHITRLFNSLSILFPVGEKFFVQAIRHYEPAIKNKKLLAEIREFYKQEAKHSREHNKFNNLLRVRGYDIDKLEREIKARLEDVKQRNDPNLDALIATVVLEKLTHRLAVFLRGPARILLRENQISDMWRWHALEECEHYHVSEKVLKSVGYSKLRYFTGYLKVHKHLLEQIASNYKELRK